MEKYYKDNNGINKLYIHDLQNYYQLELGIIPSKQDIKETINKISRHNRERRE